MCATFPTHLIVLVVRQNMKLVITQFFSILELFPPSSVQIQSDQKVSVHLMITIQKVTSNVQSVPSPIS
jgi:hypothetical protein